MQGPKQTNRRQFLKPGVVGGASAALLAACGGPQPAPATAPAAPTKAPEAAPTKAPEAAKPAATAAPAATTAPAAKPTEAAKPAATAAAKPTAAAQAAEKPGRQLIGKYEGPTIITDPAQHPKTFKEAPQLAELVKQGKLPPVEKRNQIAKEIWKIVVDQVWGIGTVGLAPAVLGVRVVKNYMGNVPERLSTMRAARMPGASHPATYYFKS